MLFWELQHKGWISESCETAGYVFQEHILLPCSQILIWLFVCEWLICFSDITACGALAWHLDVHWWRAYKMTRFVCICLLTARCQRQVQFSAFPASDFEGQWGKCIYIKMMVLMYCKICMPFRPTANTDNSLLCVYVCVFTIRTSMMT